VSRRRADEGASLVEILVTVVLIGGALVGVLVTMSTTVGSSGRNRDQVNALALLSSATDRIASRDIPRLACTSTAPGQPPTNLADIQSRYLAAAQEVINPNDAGWNAFTAASIDSIEFWDGTGFQANCYEANGLGLQLVTVRITSPSGRTIETAQVVKGDV
jgi:type II secretory pathway pseudopilin PulG